MSGGSCSFDSKGEKHLLEEGSSMHGGTWLKSPFIEEGRVPQVENLKVTGDDVSASSYVIYASLHPSTLDRVSEPSSLATGSAVVSTTANAMEEQLLVIYCSPKEFNSQLGRLRWLRDRR